MQLQVRWCYLMYTHYFIKNHVCQVHKFYHEEFLFKCYEISVMVIHSTIKPKARKAPLCAVFKSMSFGEPMSFCILLFGFFRQLEFLLYFSSPYCLALMLCLIIMWHNPKVWFQPFSLYFHGFIPKLEI